MENTNTQPDLDVWSSASNTEHLPSMRGAYFPEPAPQPQTSRRSLILKVIVTAVVSVSSILLGLLFGMMIGSS